MKSLRPKWGQTLRTLLQHDDEDDDNDGDDEDEDVDEDDEDEEVDEGDEDEGDNDV